ncbi:MAG: hypothetical protein ABW133_14580 [Polyangiaceae bacterium]
MSTSMLETANTWDLYASHRARYTELLLSSDAHGRLCLLGAGHCHDVDLEALAAHYTAIHLVDLDRAAILAAVARQKPDVRERLHVHAPFDLSGFETRWKQWKRVPPSPEEIAAASSRVIRSAGTLPGPFDVVASSCVLTQMSFAARDALGEKSPMLGPVRIALIRTHLALLMGLTAPGRTALLTTDLTSSTSFPLAEITSEQNLFDVMGDIVERAAYYHVANPNLIEQVLETEPVLRAMAGESELLPPWIWTGALDRSYFVYALRFQRRV